MESGVDPKFCADGRGVEGTLFLLLSGGSRAV